MYAVAVDIKARFDQDIAEHALAIVRDDGEYRHLRCQRPGTWTYGFDILTWPGYLAYVGDMGDFMFSRTRDMLEFFRGQEPNPDYWSEKLRGPGPAHQAVLEFDVEQFHAYVREHGLDVVDDWGGPYSSEDASRLLVEQGHVDPYDLPQMKRYCTQFMWCCHALPWAIAKYDEAKAGHAA